MLTDTHCHIYKEYYEDIDKLMLKIKKSGIDRIINNACNYESCLEVLELVKKYEEMYCVLGLHPEENLEDIDKVIKLLEKNFNNSKVIGVGEIGLDYYYTKDTREEQIDVLNRQLEFAELHNLPVVIHSREATGDMLDILKQYNLKGVIHCFNGSVEVAKEYIKLGYKLGINGVVTFKNCKLIDVIKEIGIDSLVYETDSPYLTPVPFRGQKNDPCYTNNVVDFVASNLGIERGKLVKISNRNIKDIFDIQFYTWYIININEGGILKYFIRFFKILVILVAIFGISKINVEKDNGVVFNDNSNKVLDLTAMAIKMEEIRMQDLYYPLDTYVGNLTGYVANCPLCGGTLGCTGQNVLDGTTTYNDSQYGTVRIMASSTSLQCGSIVSYMSNNEKVTAIVLDRGVTGTNLDLLVSSNEEAYSIGRKNITYDVLRFGWSRSNS